MYVLKKASGGRNLYVAKAGLAKAKSYTNSIRYAEKFRTKDQAIENSCIENEYPVEIESLID